MYINNKELTSLEVAVAKLQDIIEHQDKVGNNLFPEGIFAVREFANECEKYASNVRDREVKTVAKRIIKKRSTRKEKFERIVIVNEIIKTIALNSRGFFLNKKDGEIAFIFQKNGKLYMKNEYNKVEMCLHSKYGYPPNRFHHGGTLWNLTKEFKDFILNGGHKNIWCNYWGYSPEAVEKIQERASELGYSKKQEK